MEYLAIIYNNSETPTTEKQWEAFFKVAHQSGIFRGGSEIGLERIIVGKKISTGLPQSIGGYMKFESEHLSDLVELLKTHPVIINGGSIELLDLPESK